MSKNVGSLLLRYGCAVVSIALATWLRLLLDPALGNQFPVITFFFGVLLTAWYGGFVPALLAVVLGALSTKFFIMPPRGGFALEGREQQVGMLLYFFTSLGIALLGGVMHGAKKKANTNFEAARRQAALIDQTYDAVLVWRWNGPITFWNRGAERLYGFPHSEALGRVSHELLQTKTLLGVSGFVSLLAREGFWEGELEHKTRDGQSIVVETRMVLVRETEGSYVLEANRDVTGRRRMEVDLREANDRLESRVSERTTELAKTIDSLRESEERFRLLIEGVQEYAIFMLDLKGCVITWNLGGERNKGYRADEIIGRHFSCFYPPEEVARGKPDQALQTALMEGRSQDEGWRIRKDESRFWARVVITTVNDESGLPRGFAKITRDITESMLAVKMLQDSEAKFRSYIEKAPVAICAFRRNPDGTHCFPFSNPALERIYGLPPEDLAKDASPICMRIHPDDINRVRAAIEESARTITPWRCEYRVRNPSRGEIWVEGHSVPTLEPDGGILWQGYIDDVTERKEIEEALREREKTLRLFITHAPAAIAMFNCNMEYIFASLRWITDYGLKLEDTIGRSHYELFPDIPERWKDIHRRCLAGATEKCEQDQFPRLDGTVDWVRWEVLPWYKTNSAVGGIIILSELITQQKQAEEALHRLNAELEQGVHHLAEVNRELKERTQENEAFVYSVSHDLRSPLVNLQGFSKELGRSSQDLRALLRLDELTLAIRDRAVEVLDGPVVKSIRFIQTAVTRLSNIIDSLLRLSRVGRVIYQRRRVDMHSIVARVVESLKLTTEERGAIIQINEMPPALGDPAALEQVFANLIGNALNYLDSKRSGRIEIGTIEPETSTPNMRTYYVRDNGLGISESGKAKMFQPFQRLHPTTAQGEGMGLAITQRVIERHGGRIWFDSTAGQGSTFYFALSTWQKVESSASVSAT